MIDITEIKYGKKTFKIINHYNTDSNKTFEDCIIEYLKWCLSSEDATATLYADCQEALVDDEKPS